MSFHVDFEASYIGDGGTNLDLLKHRLAGTRVAMSFDAKLEPFETRDITVYQRVPTLGIPAKLNGVIFLGTDTPGVIYRIASNPSSPNPLTSGWLLKGDETILSQVQDGATTPVFTVPGSWIDHQVGSAASFNRASAVAAAAESTDVVRRSGNVLTSTDKNAGAGSFNFVWGVDDFVDLGAEDDGKVFQFWLRDGAAAERSANHPEVFFSSYPYNENQRDAEVTSSGGPTDFTVVDDNTPGLIDFFSFVLPAVTTSTTKWSVYHVRKSDFTKTGNPLWSRITQMRIHTSHTTPPNVAHTDYLAGVYFGDPPDGIMNVAVMKTHYHSVSTTNPMVISLTAPADGARVVGGAAILPA